MLHQQIFVQILLTKILFFVSKLKNQNLSKVPMDFLRFQLPSTALSLEGNLLRSIPPKISMLSLLKRLEVADNFIQPDGMSIKSLSKLSNLNHIGMGGKHNSIQTHLAVSKQKLTCTKKKCGDVETITNSLTVCKDRPVKERIWKYDSGRDLRWTYKTGTTVALGSFA